MKEIVHLLSQVYTENELEELEREIKKLISKYSELISPSEFVLNNEDFVLITYGDQVYKTGESKLKTLQNLLISELAEEVTIVHLLPFYPYCSDDGFSVIDYYKVNDDLGNWNDIESLSEKFKLVFDAVVNHTSYRCNWFSKYFENNEVYKDYYIEVDDIEYYSNVTRPRTSPLTHIYKINGVEKEVWTTFSNEQVDLNFKNPKVFLQILDVLLFYISEGAQIIRLDAIGFLWKEKNTNCIHLPQTHLLIKTMRKVIERVDKSVLLLSETNVPHNENISYFGDGDEAHMVYNFTLPPLLAYSILSGNTEKLNDWAQTLELPSSNVCYFNFLASHDGIGVRPVGDILSKEELNMLLISAENNGGRISYKQNTDGTKTPYEINCNYYSLLKGLDSSEELGIKRTILAHAILLTMPGLPAIYFHSIFGSENDIKGMNRSGINRRINREKFEYDNLKNRLNESNSREAIILRSLKQLVQIKKTEPAFNPYANFSFDRPKKGIFNIIRKTNDGSNIIKAIYNLGFETVDIPLEDSNENLDLISNKKYDETIRLNSLEFAWLKF